MELEEWKWASDSQRTFQILDAQTMRAKNMFIYIPRVSDIKSSDFKMGIGKMPQKKSAS